MQGKKVWNVLPVGTGRKDRVDGIKSGQNEIIHGDFSPLLRCFRCSFGTDEKVRVKCLKSTVRILILTIQPSESDFAELLEKKPC